MYRFCHPGLERASRSFFIQKVRPWSDGCSDRDSVLRRLPFRSSSGAQRMAQHGLPLLARARNHRTRDENRRGRDPLQARRPGRRRLHGGFLPRLCCLPRGLGAILQEGFHPTYNGVDKDLGGPTFGGYSTAIVVDEAFVLRVSDKLDLAGVAPLLCAGITTLFSAAALEGRTRSEGWDRWAWRPWSHGREIRPRLWCPHGFVHHPRRQGQGRQKARRRRGSGLKKSRRDGSPGKQLDFILDTVAGPHE